MSYLGRVTGRQRERQDKGPCRGEGRAPGAGGGRAAESLALGQGTMRRAGPTLLRLSCHMNESDPHARVTGLSAKAKKNEGEDPTCTRRSAGSRRELRAEAGPGEELPHRRRRMQGGSVSPSARAPAGQGLWGFIPHPPAQPRSCPTTCPSKCRCHKNGAPALS